MKKVKSEMLIKNEKSKIKKQESLRDLNISHEVTLDF